MENFFKIIGKAIVAVLFIGLSFLLATGYYLYYYQEQIMTKAFHAVTATLAYPIKAKQVEISLLKTFPQVRLSLSHVTIQEPGQATPLLIADAVSASLDITRLLRKEYVIEQLCIQQGKLNLSSYAKTKTGGFSSTQTAISTSPELVLPLHLKKIVLGSVQCTIPAEKSGKYHKIQVKSMVAKLKSQQQSQHACLEGEVLLEQLATDASDYPLNIPIHLQANIDYHAVTKRCSYRGTLNKISFKGKWIPGAPQPYMDLQMQAAPTPVTQLLSWLPLKLREQVKGYQPQGIFTCNFLWKYQDTMGIQADFTLKDASLWMKQVKKKAKITHLLGSVNVPNLQQLNTSTLHIEEYEVVIGDSQMSGNLRGSDLTNLRIKNHANITLAIPLLIEIWPNVSITSLKGRLVGDFDLEMDVVELVKPGLSNKSVKLQGVCHAQGAEGRYNGNLLKLQENGCVLIKDGKLHFKEVAGFLEGRPFELAGTMCYSSLFFAQSHQKLQGKMSLYADHIALDKLIVDHNTSPDVNNKIDWSRLSDYFQGEVVCDIDEVIYHNFQGSKIRGKVQIKPQQLVIEEAELIFAGGKTQVSSCIDVKADRLEVTTHVKLQNVQLPILFYAFNNFDQQFLKDRHLGGQICSDIHFSVTADKYFVFDTPTLQANLAMQLQHGVLKDFEPMKKLSAYVAEKDELKLLKFSSIKNDIKIADQTIYIPPMEIHTSLTSIQLSGTHTFDGKIAYQLIVPLQHTSVPTLGDQMPEINEDALAGLNLHLKLEGTTEDYALRYDSALLKLNLKENLSKQRAILSKVLKGDKAPVRMKELAQDDYFNFD